MARQAPLPLPHINVTPMIDVMLVLLIIFMIVAPLARSPLVLPRSDHAEARPEQPDEITLGIDPHGAYLLSVTGAGGPSTLSPISPAALGPRLEALYGGRTLDRILYLKADERLEFGAVQRAIAIARRSGVRVVATVTERRVQQKR